MNSKSLKINGFGNITINSPNISQDNCVYQVKTQDGFTVIGQTGNDGLWSRTEKRFRKKDEFKMFLPHLRKSNIVNVAPIYVSFDSTYRDIIEQYCIYNEWKRLICEYYDTEVKLDIDNIAVYRNIPGCREYVDSKCGNKVLDKKEALRKFLTYRENYQDIEDFKVEE